MNEDEIMAEARRRLNELSDEEKRKMWGFSESNMELIDRANKYGKSSLSKKEKNKFHNLELIQLAKAIPGKVDENAVERQVMEEFNISRDNIKNMKKNPYKSKMLKNLLVSIVMNIGAAGLAMGGLIAPAAGLEAAAGVFAIGFATQLKNYFNFKKLQRKMMDGERDEDFIRAEMYGQLYREGKGMKR